ncbi:MAG TPA: hypothetical protein VGF54_11980 [Streptosporangiaceae bacterium]
MPVGGSSAVLSIWCATAGTWYGGTTAGAGDGVTCRFQKIATTVSASERQDSARQHSSRLRPRRRAAAVARRLRGTVPANTE